MNSIVQEAAPLDILFSPDGEYVYLLNGFNNVIDVYRVNYTSNNVTWHTSAVSRSLSTQQLSHMTTVSFHSGDVT